MSKNETLLARYGDYLTRLMSRPSVLRVQLRPETALAVQVAEALRTHTMAKRYRGVWFHVPNEGKRSELNAAILKAAGMIPGTPDFVFLWENGCALIELKVGKNDLSPAQQDFRAWATNSGIHWRICRSVQEVEWFLRELEVLTPYTSH